MSIAAQEVTVAAKSVFLGLRPMVTIEPDYPAGALDLNVLPLSTEWHPVAGFPGLRCTLLVNFHFGEGKPRPAQLGLIVSLPWYPFNPADRTPQGFFIGPKSGLSWQPSTGVWTTGLHLEAGWSFPLDNWSIMVLGEYGATLFLGESNGARWSGHGGISGLFGFRLD